MIEGGSSKNFLNTKDDVPEPGTLSSLWIDHFNRHSYLTSRYGQGPGVQLFDTWAGILAPEDYKEYVLPSVKKLLPS